MNISPGVNAALMWIRDGEGGERTILDGDEEYPRQDFIDQAIKLGLIYISGGSGFSTHTTYELTDAGCAELSRAHQHA